MQKLRYLSPPYLTRQLYQQQTSPYHNDPYTFVVTLTTFSGVCFGGAGGRHLLATRSLVRGRWLGSNPAL